MPDSDAPILEKAERFFAEHVRPHAEEMDQDVEALRAAFDEMCGQDLMALRRPAKYGGPEISEKGFRAFQEMSARYSGSLSFLMTQHQSAVSMLARSENEALRAEYLPQMGDGRKLSGIGFSQLRRPGPPVMRAEPCDGGFRLNGQVPWITGWTFYHEFLIGATLPDGRAVFGFVPFEDSATVRIGPVMRLAAMETPQTVSAEVANHFLPAEKVVFERGADWAQKNDMINIVLQGHFALGCAQAGIDVVRQAFERKGLDFVREAADRLQAELDACREAASRVPVGMDSEITEEKLRLRAWAIGLAARCGHAAVAASSGAANSLQHPAQRIYREALVYTVSAQTSEIMRATLERLAGREHKA
jgi:alkylation response protein AidB-like acyl-CoA dehydrogenase